ncbi:hypothetical protein DFH11DRAFT_1729689 [Phellopilus nigrolimitatus]|nr:hypothetical protein DFH11DRAFT_1729689 [Phellopilus nigrolimitatus]
MSALDRHKEARRHQLSRGYAATAGATPDARSYTKRRLEHSNQSAADVQQLEEAGEINAWMMALPNGAANRSSGLSSRLGSYRLAPGRPSSGSRATAARAPSRARRMRPGTPQASRRFRRRRCTAACARTTLCSRLRNYAASNFAADADEVSKVALSTMQAYGCLVSSAKATHGKDWNFHLSGSYQQVMAGCGMILRKRALSSQLLSYLAPGLHPADPFEILDLPSTSPAVKPEVHARLDNVAAQTNYCRSTGLETERICELAISWSGVGCVYVAKLIQNMRGAGLIPVDARLAAAFNKDDRANYVPDTRDACVDAPQGSVQRDYLHPTHGEAAKHLLPFLVPGASVLYAGSGLGCTCVLFHHLGSGVAGSVDIEHMTPLSAQSLAILRMDGLEPALATGHIEIVAGDGRAVRHCPRRHGHARGAHRVRGAAEDARAHVRARWDWRLDNYVGRQGCGQVRDEMPPLGVMYVPFTDAETQAEAAAFEAENCFSKALLEAVAAIDEELGAGDEPHGVAAQEDDHTLIHTFTHTQISVVSPARRRRKGP